MKTSRSMVILFFALCWSTLARAQASASLLVTTDTTCDWKLDGQSQGRLNVDDAKVVHTTAGEHLLQATSVDGKLKWQGMVTADPSAQKMVKMPVSDSMPTWTDPATGLMWAKRDNNSDVTWQQANNYCTNLQLDGKTGWRLPVIDELAAIYDQSQNVDGWHIKGGIHITGISWSNSAGSASGEAWVFYFVGGGRGSGLLDDSSSMRALCVRRSGE